MNCYITKNVPQDLFSILRDFFVFIPHTYNTLLLS